MSFAERRPCADSRAMHDCDREFGHRHEKQRERVESEVDAPAHNATEQYADGAGALVPGRERHRDKAGREDADQEHRPAKCEQRGHRRRRVRGPHAKHEPP